MAGSGVVFAKNWMMNDGGCHEQLKYQVRSTKHKASTANFETVRYRNGFRCFKKQFRGLEVGNAVCQSADQDEVSRGEIRMKRVLALIFVLALLVITGTLVSTDWTNAAAPDGDRLTSVAN